MGYVLGYYIRKYNKMNDRGRTCDHLSLIEFFINNNKQVCLISLTFAARPYHPYDRPVSNKKISIKLD